MGDILMLGKSQAAMFRGEKPVETSLAPRWALRDIASHAVDFWLSTEDLPKPENRVTLQPDGSVKRQSLRRRHQLPPQHRGRKSGTDCDGQRSPRGRPPACAPRR